MEFPKQLKDQVYKLLQEPTLDKFREFLHAQTGEHTMPVSPLNLITFSQKYIPAFIYTIFLTFDVFKAGTFLTLL